MLSHLIEDKIVVKQINHFSMNPPFFGGAVFIADRVFDCRIITKEMSSP